MVLFSLQGFAGAPCLKYHFPTQPCSPLLGAVPRGRKQKDPSLRQLLWKPLQLPKPSRYNIHYIMHDTWLEVVDSIYTIYIHSYNT